MGKTAKPKILIIDDDVFLLNMYTIKFKESAFEVFSESDSALALNKLRDSAFLPDVILLDLVMPKWCPAGWR